MPIRTTTSPASPASARRRAGRPLRGLPGGEPVLQPNTLPHFKEFCLRLRLDNGKPFVIEPFQELILADYFDGVLETLVLLPSGNGKTTLFAALALYHLLMTPDPAVYIMAASRDQAGLMLKHIRRFIEKSRGLQKRVKALRRGANLIGREGFIEVLASDADTADGIGPTLALIDELHRHKDTQLYVVAFKGLKKRGGQLLHCTTAGESENSPLGQLRKRGLALPGLTRNGKHRYARAADGTFAFHEWALDQDDDMHDMKVVKQANPLSTITLRHLQAEHAAMKWWAWARFACGLWVAGEHSAISPIDWAECPAKSIDVEQPAYLAVDLAWVNDCTAIVPVQALAADDVRIDRPAVIEPPGDGTAIRERQILDTIRVFKGRYRLKGVVIDPEAGGRQLIEKLEGSYHLDDGTEVHLGLEVIEHSQKNEPMIDAAMKLDRLVGERFLSHPHETTLTAHVLACAAKRFDDGRMKLVKRRKDPEPIDAGVASAMGVRVALADFDIETQDDSVYGERDLLILD